MYTRINRTGERQSLYPKENQLCRDAMLIAEENGYRHISVHDIENANEIEWKGIKFNRLLVKESGLYWFVEWIGKYPFSGIVVEKIGEIFEVEQSKAISENDSEGKNE